MSMKRKVVAVIDNDPGTLKALTRLLVAHGFIVEPYVSAEAFLEGEAVNDVSCVVLDINLDGMSGVQLRRKLASALPVIFVTASDSPEIHRAAVNAGCVAYLRKPFPSSFLIGALEKVAA